MLCENREMMADNFEDNKKCKKQMCSFVKQKWKSLLG